MRYVLPIAQGANVRGIHNAILRNQTLWNRHPERAVGPHEGIDDIWIRYNAKCNYDPRNPAAFNAEHESVWYPAYHDLRDIDNLVFPLMAAVRGERLGGILITRVPPGHEVKWHVDTGWHAEYYDKYAIQIASNEHQQWHHRDGSIVTMPGDIYWFNNQAEHRVTNNSLEDRITLIVCIRHSKS